MRSAALQRTGVLAGVGATLLAMVSVQSGAAIAITLFASVGPVAVVALRVVTASGFLVSTARVIDAAISGGSVLRRRRRARRRRRCAPRWSRPSPAMDW
jgi:threonine/homoserine efflux transporter RhtA